MKENADKAKTIVGLAVACGLVTGFLGWLAAVFSVMDRNNWTAAAVALVASALAFGLVANAMLRE